MGIFEFVIAYAFVLGIVSLVACEDWALLLGGAFVVLIFVGTATTKDWSVNAKAVEFSSQTPSSQ